MEVGWIPTVHGRPAGNCSTVIHTLKNKLQKGAYRWKEPTRLGAQKSGAEQPLWECRLAHFHVCNVPLKPQLLKGVSDPATEYMAPDWRSCTGSADI